LLRMMVHPYLGARAAARELARPAPAFARVRPPRRAPRADALEGLKMRLTYRTSLVLSVIRDRPRASNREVADCAGIVDQGQISKLLSRLAALELIENRGAGQAGGATNAWYLTDRGARLEKAARLR
jgi:hypothetical protein